MKSIEEKREQDKERKKEHGYSESSETRYKYAQALKIIAYIELIVAIISAIFIWYNFGTIDIPSSYGYHTYTEYNYIAIASGFILMLQGGVFFIILQILRFTSVDIMKIKDQMLHK